MLTIRDLSLHYGQSQILSGISMTADPGAITCVLGTNGVGKTSLLKAIAGTHHRSGGTYELAGEAIHRPPPNVLAKKGVAIVPQGRDIFPLLSVHENLEIGFACLPRSERRVPEEVFELFPVLAEMRGRRGGDLSGGQQQQLAIARALVTRPRLLVLDEPTEGIQPSIIKQIANVLSFLRDQGTMAILLVEQYLAFAHDLGDSFVVLQRGRIARAGVKSQLTMDELKGLMSA